MNRRVFLKSSILATAAIGTGFTSSIEKTHIITLSFDDGFKKSFYKIADIFEENDLSACFNVIASGHFPNFHKVDDFILPELLGNFDDWNNLKYRGHEVMPHSWKHLDLAKQPLEESKEWIIKCLDYFAMNLEAYKNEESVFNFSFNSSTPELEEFALSKVLAIRSYEIDESSQKKSSLFRKGCRSNGPQNIDSWVEEQTSNFLNSDGGWLVLNVHGLDNEGWGPMSTLYLKNLLKRLVKIRTLEILPTAYVLNRIKNK